jgi:hypothetical protein
MDAGGDEDIPREVTVKFEGEFEVDLQVEGTDGGEEENRLIPIRTCHLEIRQVSISLIRLCGWLRFGSGTADTI